MITRNPRLTAAGLALFTNQEPGFSVAVTHIAVGSGVYAPTGAENALQAEFARFPVESGTVISPSQIQLGALIKDADPSGKSPNNKYVGEIGFYVGSTLLAVLSQASGALFYKSPDLDVPISYVLDFSTLPPGSLTVDAPTVSASLQLAAQTAKSEADAARNGKAEVEAVKGSAISAINSALKTIQSAYYGTYAADPIVRPDGTTMQKGDRYFNSASNAEKTWNGAAWYIPNIDSAALANSNGASLIGYGDATVSAYLAGMRVPIEIFGVVGDYDPATKTGTDNNAAIERAITSGLRIQLKPGAKYMITSDILVHSGMDWYGDESYSAAFYPKFATTGKIMFKSPVSGPVIQNISLKGFTVVRIGQNAEHGLVIDNFDGLHIDLRVVSDGGSEGGAVGISPFYPQRRPGKNFNIKVYLEQCGDYGVELGDAQNGDIQVFAKDCYREVIGLEPITRDAWVIPASSVAGNVITLAGHGLETGDPLIYSSQGNADVLPRTTYWFAIRLSADTFSIADSRAAAAMGTAMPLAGWSGNHWIIRCGIVDNINILPSFIADEKSIRPLQYANTTGYVILTGNSGGWIGTVNFSPITVAGTRNPSSYNTSGFRLEGVKDLTINSPTVKGTHRSVYIQNGTVANIRNKAGTILNTSTPIVALASGNRLTDVTLADFYEKGVYLVHGNNRIEGGAVRSSISGAVGFDDTSAIDLGGGCSDLTISTPNGTPWNALPVGNNNKHVESGLLVSRHSKFSAESKIRKVAKTSSNICLLAGAGGSAALTYSGTIRISAKSKDFSSDSNNAVYILDVIKAHPAATPALTLVRQAGLVNGAGATYPSFTFYIENSYLLAAPIASTSTTADWLFYIETEGDLIAL